jgi:hypothetical protein
MMSADPASAPVHSHDRFFGALAAARDEIRDAGAEVVVLVSGEHFTNFFLDNLPQVAVGLGESHLGPVEDWLGLDRVEVPGHPGLAHSVLDGLVERGHLPALSHRLVLDHGFMTVYHELRPESDLPVVPVVVNCTTPPLMTLRQAWRLGVDLGAAIRASSAVDRVALVGAGGLSHFVGEPRVGDIDEQFDRWFLDMLEKGCPDELLDLPNDELVLAGNGTGEVRAWVMVAGAMAGGDAQALAYEPIYEWINGMAVLRHEADPA